MNAGNDAREREATTPPEPQLRLLSVTECCDLLGVSRWQVYQLLNSKQLPSTHIGRRRVVRASDLATFLDNLTKQGA